MRPTRTHRRHPREIAPVLRSTWDGRPLLPQEVPIIAVEEVPPASADPLGAALAMFDDMLSRPTPRVATPITAVDHWSMIRRGDSGPQLIEAAVDEVLESEPTTQECAPGAVTPHGWGDSGDLIEEWFRTGEYLAAEPAEDEPRTTWLRGIYQRVKRVVSGAPVEAWENT